jgi:arginyl-tRNA synthetase
VLRKAAEMDLSGEIAAGFMPNDKELDLIKLVARFPGVVEASCSELNPSLIANYAYELAKEYNQFYHDHSILSAETGQQVKFRLVLSDVTARVIKTAFELLGIDVPERM